MNISTDGANSGTVTNASGNTVTFNGTYSVQTLTNSGNLNLDGTTSPGAVVRAVASSGPAGGGTTAQSWSGCKP